MPGTVAWLLALGAALTWANWPTLTTLVKRWSQDPQYTHGYVVPLFIALVLWLRRDRFPARHVRPAWGGVAFLLAAALCRLAGSMFAFEWLEAGSILPALIGLIWLVCGPAAVLWAWPAGVLLLFVLPWPWQVDQLVTHPLRRFATVCSTYLLQTLGVPALARGNIIVVNDLEVGIVEACSGLGMLMTFFALSTSVAFAVDRPRFDKAVLFLSAIPIGMAMNVLRITVTVFLFQYASEKVARVVFHDVAGWVMMPMALAVLWLELRFLDCLWLPPEQPAPVPVRPAGGPIHEPKSRPEVADRPAPVEVPDAAQ